ncbi:MAG: RNA polymerase sigma factor [Gammaproteobacteria bacterium]|nr:RNA polymerase sigma factor [Gammaproteobacteria bacterium]NNE04337.1 RNA polymerase sigma factor [Xanthomonadales bacterium]
MNSPNARPITNDPGDSEARSWLPLHVRGDAQAFGRLMNAYRGFVMTLLWRYGVDPASRDDLFQDVFMKIHQSAASYQPSQALRPWLATITLNTLRNHRRKQYRRSRVYALLFSKTKHEYLDKQNPGADQVLEHDSTATWLEDQIAKLPDRQREVLVLSTMNGLSMKDIARVVAIPENTVKTRLRRARLALAEAISRREAVEN